MMVSAKQAAASKSQPTKATKAHRSIMGVYNSVRGTMFLLFLAFSNNWSLSCAWMLTSTSTITKNNFPLLHYSRGVNSSIRRIPPWWRKIPQYTSPSSDISMISSGFSFQDGEQILVSVQKPFGIILEQQQQQGDDDDDDGGEGGGDDGSGDGIIYVTEVDPNGSAGRAGVQVGDILVAVQNASVESSADLDSVLNFIANGPKVMNLRLLRR